MKRPPHLKRYWNALRPRRGGAVAQKRRQKLRSLLQPQQAVDTRSPLNYLRLLLGLGTATLLSVLLSIHLMPNHISWHVGDTAEREIIAPRTVRYVDSETTNALKEAAAAQEEKRYVVIPEASANAQDAIRIAFEEMEAHRERRSVPSGRPISRPSPVLPKPGVAGTGNAVRKTGAPAPVPPAAPPASPLQTAEKIALSVRRQTSTDIPPTVLVALLALPAEQTRLAQTVAVRLVEKEMSRAITENTDELKEAREGILRSEILNSLSTPALRDAVARLAGAALRPTRFVNTIETDRAREAARATVPVHSRRVTAGSVIVRPGDRITSTHINQFRALGLQSSRPDAFTIAVITLLVFFLTTLAGFYLRQFHPEIYENHSSLLLLAILSIISVAGLKVGSTLLGFSAPAMQFGYLGMMCVASSGMVIALLLSPRAALLIVTLLSAVSGIVLNNELRFALVTLASSLTGIVAVTTLKNRNDLLRATLLLCGSNALLNVLVGYLEADVVHEIGMSALWGIVAGVFAVGLFYLGVAIFEKWFGITTHLRLLELSDPATPLLQEFRLRVPGTYAHSLMVSNLAHAASEAVGADALLVRVAAYYHDIGKMNRPEFFIENQSGMENIHDRLAPSLSAIILASHVKEGVEIAAEIGLPPRVRELIEQHHGTTLMRYFYHRATKGLPNPMLEAQFRYPGPKPQSREAAILMLADSVEAASRTLQRPTPTRIREFVARMVEEKLADDQLAESDLTLRDLATIQEVFTRTLCGVLHARIDYPDERNEPRSTEPTTLAVASVGGVTGLPPLPTDRDAVMELPPSLRLEDLPEGLTGGLSEETKGPSPDLFPLMAQGTTETEGALRTLSLPPALAEDLAETVCPAFPRALSSEAAGLGASGEEEPPFSEYSGLPFASSEATLPLLPPETKTPHGTDDSGAARPHRSFLGNGRNGGSKTPRKRR
ncbi:MAG: HDIG domain-containing protein [Capsulimonadales bacterium]|nr:HDIG domain-containing protein [Capsulimonadales bacterium]